MYIKKIILTGWTCVLFTVSHAQFRTLNSAHGEGRTLTSVFSQNRFCGQLSAAYVGNLVNNYQNPASYGDASLTSIEFGGLGLSGSYDYKDSSKSSGGVGLSHFTIMVPLSAGKSGLNLGYYQHASTNYGIQSLGSDSTFGGFSNHLAGSGNIYNFFAGVGVRMKKLKLGVNLTTQFGRNDYLDDIVFPDSTTLPRLRKRDAITQLGLLYTLGAQYDVELSKTKQFVFGAYYTGTLLKNGSLEKTNQNIFYLSGAGYQYINIQDTNYSIDLPFYSKLGVGMSFINNKSLLIGTEWTYENFSEFKDRFTGQYLQNAWHAHLGVEYKPYMNRNNDSRKYFNRVTYRLGGVFGKSELNYESSINELKFMGGVTLPILGRNVGYITLGAEYATRGFGEAGKISDNIFSFHLIMTFADKWFVRQKFD